MLEARAYYIALRLAWELLSWSLNSQEFSSLLSAWITGLATDAA